MQVRNFIERKLIIGAGALGVLALGGTAMVLTTGAASAQPKPQPAVVQQRLDVQNGLNVAQGSQTGPDTATSAETSSAAESTTPETADSTEAAATGPDTDNIQQGGGAQTGDQTTADTNVPAGGQ